MQGLVTRTIEAGKKSQSEAGKQCQTEIDWNNLSMTISGPAVTLKLKNKDQKEKEVAGSKNEEENEDIR